MGEDSILPLALATETLLHLTLKIHEPELLSLIHWEDNLTSLPFPKLKTLTLYYDTLSWHRRNVQTSRTPPLRYLDELITTRCLPQSNAASRLHNTLSPLEKLVIKLDREFMSPLMDSAHYQSAMTRVIEETDGELVATLSWVLEEAATLAQGLGEKCILSLRLESHESPMHPL